MNRNATPIILIVLAIGIYFTYTRDQFVEVAAVRAVNDQYKTAIDNSESLLEIRDNVLAAYNKISPDDQDRLEKLIPNNVDNVRLIIDINGVAARHGLSIKNIKTEALKNSNDNIDESQAAGVYNTVTLSFDISSNYQTFQNFLKDLEKSLRIIEISKIALKANASGVNDYNIEIKTFWLK